MVLQVILEDDNQAKHGFKYGWTEEDLNAMWNSFNGMTEVDGVSMANFKRSDDVFEACMS